MQKAPISARFIVALKSCSTKPLYDVISKVFKMIFNRTEIFDRRSLFYTCFKKFWVVENSFPIVTKMNKRDTKKKPKSISTFCFTTLLTTIPHNQPTKVLSEIINFVFKSKTRSRIGFSKTSIYWASKGSGRRFFTRQILIDAISFSSQNFILPSETWYSNKRLAFLWT